MTLCGVICWSLRCPFKWLINCVRKACVFLQISRGGSRAAATSKMERFVIIVNGWKPLTIMKSASSWILQQLWIRVWISNKWIIVSSSHLRKVHSGELISLNWNSFFFRCKTLCQFLCQNIRILESVDTIRYRSCSIWKHVQQRHFQSKLKKLLQKIGQKFYVT